MAVGFGENNIRKALDEVWGEQGYCFRFPQKRGQLGVISDLLLLTKSNQRDYSIEVKRITVKKKDNGWEKPRPLNFNADFTNSTSKHEEFKHQLERQVILSRRCGLTPIVILKVVYANYRSDTYVFDSEELYKMMKNGAVSIKSDTFKSLHKEDILKKITRGYRCNI